MIKLILLLSLATCGLARPGQSSDNTNDCRSCNDLVYFINKVNDNLDDHHEGLVEWCSHSGYGATKQICKPVIKDYLETLSTVFDGDFCAKTEMCPNGTLELLASNGVDDTNCDFCTNIVSNVKGIVTSQSTEDEFKQQVAQVCGYLGSFRDECTQLVDKNIDDWFDYIRNRLNPKDICQRLGFCLQVVIEEEEEMVPFTTIERSAVPVAVEEDNMNEVSITPECLLCEQMTGILLKRLKDNKTRVAIISELDSVCDRLMPKDKQPECESFVNQYTDELINLLIAETNPKVICNLLGVCTSKTKELWSKEACFECESVAHFIQNELYDFNKEKQIDEWIETQLCDRLNNVMAKDTCTSFIEQYGPSILNLIAQREFDSKILCQQQLKLCPATTFVIPQIELMNDKAGLCDTCIEAVTRLDEYLASKETEEEIADVASQICNEFEGKRKDECVTIITVYGPYFMQMIGRMSDPRKVCKSVDICEITGQVSLLGGHKCTFGPTYWCHTSNHAEACQATDYCLKNIWKPINN